MRKGEIFQSVVGDLSAWKILGERAIGRASRGVVHRGRESFDALSAQAFIKSGKGTFPIKGGVTFSRVFVKVSLFASTKKLPAEHFPIKPSLVQDTTGLSRAKISLTVRSERAEPIQTGFIWKGRLWKRLAKGRITRVSSGVSAGMYLSEQRFKVLSKMQEAFGRNIDKELAHD